MQKSLKEKKSFKMSRTWFSRRGLTCESETFSIKTHSNADADLNGNRLLTTLDLVPGVSLAPIGSTPNANGASVASGVLNLQPANGSFGGVVTTGSQPFVGVKTFSSGIRLGTGNLNLDTYTHIPTTCRFIVGSGGTITSFFVNGITGNPNSVPVDVYRMGVNFFLLVPSVLAIITISGDPCTGFSLQQFSPPLPNVFGALQPCVMVTDDPDVTQFGYSFFQAVGAGVLGCTSAATTTVSVGNYRATFYSSIVIP